MKTLENQILAGEICPYCLQKSQLVDSSIVYGKSFGSIYICFDCDAFVGCHEGTTIAKGKLANSRLRQLRKQAHEVFDPLWKAKAKRDRCGCKTAREAGYTWLSQLLGIERSQMHIGMMDEEQCLKIIEICSKY